MSNSFKNLADGIGTLSIVPAGVDLEIRVDSRTDAEMLAEDWRQVGRDLSAVIETIDGSQEKQRSEKKTSTA